MKKLGPYLGMVLITLVIAAGDLYLLTRSATLSRLARAEVEAKFGDLLEVADVQASLDGVVTLDGVKVKLGGPTFRPQAIDQVVIEFRGRLGGSIRRVTLDGVRLHLSPELVAELRKGESKKSIKDLFPNPDDLPQIVVKGGTVSASLPEVFPRGPQDLVLGECTLTPERAYRGHLGALVENGTYGRWTVDGEIDAEAGRLHLIIESPFLLIRPQMREPLTKNLQDIYEKYMPGGIADVRLEVQKEPGSDEVDFKVRLLARDMQLRYRYFDYQVEDIAGEIDFFKNGFHIKNMTGRHGPAKLRFDGVAGGYPADSPYHFRLEMDDVPLDADLRAALKEESRKAWDRFAPMGVVNARGIVHRDRGENLSVHIPVEISAIGASLKFQDFPYEIKNVTGDMVVDGDDLKIKRLIARDGDATFAAEGEIRDLTADAAVDLTLDLHSIELDDRLKMALPQEARKAWDTIIPGGRIDAQCRLMKEKGKEFSYLLTIQARGNTLRHAEFPVAVSGLEGEVEVAPGQVRLRHLTGKAHGARVAAHGLIGADAVELDLDVVGLTIDDALKSVLPPEVGDFLKQIKLGGVVGFMAGYKSRKTGPKEFTVALKLSKGVVDTDPRIEEVEGHVALEGIYEKELLLRGPIAVSSATVAGKRVTDVGASLNVKGSKVNFINIKGTGYGGIVAGRSFAVDTQTGEFFSEGLTVDRLDLREYSLDTQGYAKKTLGGKVSLSIQDLGGKAADPATIRAHGRLTIRDGVLWDVPVLASIFTLNPQDLFKSKQQFDSGAIDFEIKDRKIIIDKLSFSSESVSLLGRGTVDFDGRLDLVLKTKTGFFGIDFLPINLVTGLFDELKGAFHGVAVTGTFEKPETSQKFFPGK